jgi:hypothetical protein
MNRFPEPPPSGSFSLVARILKIALGAVLTIAGMAMLVLPGPGLLTLLAGLALLANELVWARRLDDRIRRLIRLSPPRRRR